MYTLKEKTKEIASFTIGIKIEEFLNFDFDEEMEYVDSFGYNTCGFLPEEDERIIGRGNPLLARNEFLLMDEVDKELSGEIG